MLVPCPAWFNMKSLLRGSLLRRKRYAEAEPLLLAGYEGMRRREETIPPGGKVRRTEAIERLVQHHEALGEPGKAAAWRARPGPADLLARPAPCVRPARIGVAPAIGLKVVP